MNDNNILYCKSVEGLTRPARRFAMTFYDEMRALVLRHGAIHNPYLDRFKTGALTDEEFRRFAVEFYNFARFFPKILVAQLVNTEDEAVADELTTVLYSELGRSEEHTSELQSPCNLVCRLLLEKKKNHLEVH